MTMPPPVILCVEDEADLRADLVEELAEAGYRVIEAADGEQALAALDGAPPDLVLCDINLPGVSGYEILRRIRAERPDLADLPFVFLTALADPREIIEGKRAGADDYLVKPVDYDLMRATVEARLRQVARMRAAPATDGARLRAALSDVDEAAEKVLDLLAPGIVLICQRGRIVRANRAARSMAGDGLHLGEVLDAADGPAGAELRKVLGRVLAAARAGTEDTAGLSLPRPSGRRDLMAVICALPGQSAPGKPAAAVILTDPETRAPVPRNVLAQLFGLTPAETTLALELAHGKRPGDIATGQGVAQTTVAFHLRNLFQKTGTNRQADLVALVLACPGIVARPDDTCKA